jgi:hypothetical protein
MRNREQRDHRHQGNMSAEHQRGIQTPPLGLGTERD